MNIKVVLKLGLFCIWLLACSERRVEELNRCTALFALTVGCLTAFTGGRERERADTRLTSGGDGGGAVRGESACPEPHVSTTVDTGVVASYHIA